MTTSPATPSSPAGALPGFSTPAVGFEQPEAMLRACHDRVQRSLDLLQRLLTHIDSQGHDSASRDAARDVLRYFDVAAPLHHQDEELHLFPVLLLQGDAQQQAAVQRLQREHVTMQLLWEQVRVVLEDWSHAQASDSHANPQQRQAIQAFCAIYPEHIVLEDSLVYPAAFAALGTDAAEAAGREMQSRRQLGHNPPRG